MESLHRSMGETAAANDIYETYEAFVDNGENDGQLPSCRLAEESWIVRELIDVAYMLQGLQNCKFLYCSMLLIIAVFFSNYIFSIF